MCDILTYTNLREDLPTIQRVSRYRDEVVPLMILPEAVSLVSAQILTVVIIAPVPANQAQVSASNLLLGPVIEHDHLDAALH